MTSIPRILKRDRRRKPPPQSDRRKRAARRASLPQLSQAIAAIAREGGVVMRRAQPETQLHRALIDHLQWRARSDVWFCHIPNGGARSRIEAAIFKSLGVRPQLAEWRLLRRPDISNQIVSAFTELRHSHGQGARRAFAANHDDRGKHEQ